MSDLGHELPAEEVRELIRRAAEMAADYLTGCERYTVLPPVAPGEVAARLPERAPEEGEPWERILADYRELIEPNVSHWNHPGFLAYFSITGSAPGVAAETLTAALNVNTMLWRSGPASTELEERTSDWVRQLLGLPETFRGHINDTASTSTLVALAAARHALPGAEIRSRGMAGRSDLPALTIYTSEQAHSSVDKAAIVLGLGTDNVRRIATDDELRLDPAALAAAIAEDRRAGRRPMAVIATLGTTSATSFDPVATIADLCAEEGIWLHVDAAYGGPAALCDEHRPLFAGWERADSIVINPHKWLFVPVDCSLLWVRDPHNLQAAFSLVPEYLRTAEQDEVTNLMDFGFQLGRRFRALKLWMVLRAYGAQGLRAAIRRQIEMAAWLAEQVETEPGFELAAPAPMSLVCLRAFSNHPPGEADRLNEELMERVNADGRFFLSHTKLGERYTLRVAIGNLKTEQRHIEALWNCLRDGVRALGG